MRLWANLAFFCRACYGGPDRDIPVSIQRLMGAVFMTFTEAERWRRHRSIGQHIQFGFTA